MVNILLSLNKILKSNFKFKLRIKIIIYIDNRNDLRINYLIYKIV